jgi:hypothetical protein
MSRHRSAILIDLILTDHEKYCARIRDVVRQTQQECDHNSVRHLNGSPTTPRRICVHCRLEEVGDRFATRDNWRLADYTPGILGNQDGRRVETEHLDAFCRLRLPHAIDSKHAHD